MLWYVVVGFLYRSNSVFFYLFDESSFLSFSVSLVNFSEVCIESLREL